MPRSVLVVGSSEDLFADVQRALLLDRRFLATEALVHCDGAGAPLTNIYPVDLAAAEWDGFAEREGMPDPRDMSTLILECRDPAWVAAVGRLVADHATAPIWVVDSADRVWPAGEIDPERLSL